MNIKTTVHDCRILKLPHIQSYRKGSITPIYNNEHVPFAIKRVYYLYDVPAGSKRGGHAHKELQQLIVAVSGSFDIILKDGKNERKISLNRPFYGLFLPTMVWRELLNFSSGSICLVLASLPYDEEDYYRDYYKYLKAKCQK
jgi:hypothetical protein